jgi:protein CpxP
MKKNVITKSKTKNAFSKTLIAIAFLTLQTTFAQRPEWTKQNGERPEHADFMQDFTAEQMATLQTKRMTLFLNLSQDQIDKVYDINLKAASYRKSKIAEMENKKKEGKPDSEKRYEMMTTRLDNRIKYKSELAKELTKEQLEKWQTMAHKSNWESAHSMGGKPNFTSRNN